MWTVLIPIVTIGGILVVFYLFKDKFTGRNVKAYDDAYKAWSENKQGVIHDLFSDAGKFKMLQDAVGESPIECLCPCEPRKSFGKSLLKGGVELLTMRESFDMSLYFFAIAGGELHLMQSDGSMVVSHDAWKLDAMRQVDIRSEGGVKKVTNLLSANNTSAASKDSLFFQSNGVDYGYKLLDFFLEYAAFEVEKSYGTSNKHGVNPFYRTTKTSATEDTMLKSVYGPESIASFREKIGKLQ